MRNRRRSRGRRCRTPDIGERFFRSTFRNLTLPVAFCFHEEVMEAEMGRGILLWLLGVPIPVIILLWLLFGR
jgi:hypothetical protein